MHQPGGGGLRIVKSAWRDEEYFMSPSVMRSAVLSCALLCLGASLPGCTTNPTTGRSQFNALSRDEEIALGAQAMPEMVKEYGGEVQSADLRQYVSRIGRSLADQTEADYPSLPWEFTLLDSDVINAFALPGGKVFMSRGLAEKMTNEAQLAGVLGHEVGHVTARHINDRMTDQLTVGILATAAGVAVGATSDNDLVRYGAPIAFGVGSQVVLLSFSRGQELESDELGVRYMVKVGYDPKGQLQVMEILDREAGSERSASFFATHPDPKARIEAIEKLLKGEYAYTQNNPQYTLREREFREQFLARLPAKTSPKKAERVFDLSRPALWCGVCAASEELTTEAQRHREEAGRDEAVVAMQD